MAISAMTRRFGTHEVTGPIWRSGSRSGNPGSHSRGTSRVASACVTPTPLLPAVIKIKEVVASFEDLRTTLLVDKVIVQGTVVEQIFFVDGKNVVRERVERVPFAQALEIPGARPGMDVELKADIEFIITEINETGTEVKDKIVIVLDVTVTAPSVEPYGIIIDRVIGQARQQVLLIKIKVFVIAEVIKEAIAVAEIIVVQEQVLVVKKIPLEAIKIKAVDSVIQNLTTQVLQDKVVFQGTVHKTISFVGFDNIVHVVQEDVPFSHVLSVPGVAPGAPVQASARVEFIIPELNVKEGILKQKIVLIVSAEVGVVTRELTVVIDVIAPGVTTTKVSFFTNGGIVTAVTDVRGPGVISVSKTTIFVRIVDGPPQPVPLEVVTDVVLAEQTDVVPVVQ